MIDDLRNLTPEDLLGGLALIFTCYAVGAALLVLS